MFFKKTAVRALALMLILCMAVLAFAGCNARNPNVTVMLVGNLKVGMTKYYSLYNSYKNFYGSYGMYNVSTAEDFRQFQDIVFDHLAETYLPLYWANQNGVTLSAEEEAKVQADLEAQLNEYLDSFKDKIDSSLTDAEAIRAAELKLLKKDLRTNGWTYKDYVQMLLDNIHGGAVATKYMNGIYDERVSVTAEDVQARYDELLAEQTATYAEKPVQYFTDYNAHISNGTLQPLVAPEGYRFVKHILIAFAKEGQTKDVDAIVAEVQQKLDSGVDFDELVADYGEDPGMQSEPYISTGYLISADTIDKYYDHFGEAAMALEKIGDVSAPVETTAGYHFIQYTSDVDTAPATFESIKDALEESMISAAKSDIYAELLKQWTADTKIVKYYKRVNTIR